jgi:dTDP-4-dehydrorhamnose 3,5-epimerase
MEATSEELQQKVNIPINSEQMKIIETGFEGLYIIEPAVFRDERGYFFESFNKSRFTESGIEFNPIQDNESRSSKGVVRGLHYQLNPSAQAKLIRVVAGAIFDVAVDLRRTSSTFGKWFGIELDEEGKRQLFIPRGFAHGFSVISDHTTIQYKCDNLYNPKLERGISPFDKTLAIDWRVTSEEATVSDKDKRSPLFAVAEMNF